MKTCPFCAEEIKDGVKICKHCKGDLSKTLIRQDPAKRSRKKIVFLIVLVVMTWFISLPIIIVWVIWKKGKFSKNKKIVFTVLALACYAIVMSIFSYSMRQPVITITEPENNFSIQASSTIIKGHVSPGHSKLKINDQPISIMSNGEFTYQAKLDNASNAFNLSATNNTKKSSVTININRIFTEAELMERNAQQAEIEARRQAEAARSKAEQAAYESTPAGQLCKKYSSWTKDECENVAERKFWIGMTYEMLVASFGSKPDSANPSNYGNGTSWQYCWHYQTPSCFYDNNNDGIIDAYN